LDFHFFFNLFLLMVLHDAIFNMTVLICEVCDFVSKNFYKLHGVGVLNQDPINKKNSSSFIITILRVELEPCVLNLVWK
jgi:hypothetical protein